MRGLTAVVGDGILWQNIALALGIKVVFLVLAVFGSATMRMPGFCRDSVTPPPRLESRRAERAI